MKIIHPIDTRDKLFVVITLLISIGLYFIPSHFEYPYPKDSTIRTSATVTEVDNSLIKVIGPVVEGVQQLRITIDKGTFAGREFETTNNLIGKIELDKFFSVGDRIFVVLDLTEDRTDVAYANAIDHYRTNKTLLLVLLFFVCLAAVGGWIGVKAMVSFICSAMLIFKLLLPAILWGWNPILVALGVVTILTAVIIFLVGGLCRKGLTAFIGSMSGVLVTTLLAMTFTHLFKIHGAVRPFTETLLYSGFGNLNLADIFIAGVFLASSGAVMDLAMDISAAMTEVREQNPAITRKGLILSGLTVGRHAVGTMTTTLLLAYSGGYTGMLMTFIAQGVPLENVINMVYVSSEIIHTLVGSFGLVLVAPLTALAGGFILIPKGSRETILCEPKELADKSTMVQDIEGEPGL